MNITDLYKEVILEHNHHPRNFGIMENADCLSEKNNPLCGDFIKIYIKLNASRFENISFEGHGCAISKASASLMTIAVKNKTKEEVYEIIDNFTKLITGSDDFNQALLGDLTVFSGISAFPSRVKCANLAWQTLKDALNKCENAKNLLYENVRPI